MSTYISRMRIVTMDTPITENKWEITTKYTRAQIFSYNDKCITYITKRDAKIKKMDQQIQKINEQIQKLGKQISQIKNLKSEIQHKIWDHEIQIETRNARYMTSEAIQQQEEFFDSVIMFASFHRWNPDFQTMKAYQLSNGKWYTQRIGIPCYSNGDMDESRTYFEKTEVEI